MPATAAKHVRALQADRFQPLKNKSLDRKDWLTMFIVLCTLIQCELKVRDVGDANRGSKPMSVRANLDVCVSCPEACNSFHHRGL